MERPLDTLTLSCARPTAPVQLVSELHCTLGSSGFTPDALSRRVVGDPREPPPSHSCPAQSSPFSQLPALLHSSKYCISCGGPGLRALFQLGRLLSASQQKKQRLCELGTEREGQKAAWGSKKCCQGRDGLSLSCLLSRDG